MRLGWDSTREIGTCPSMAKLNGPLTLKWVEQVVPVYLFRPNMSSSGDPLHLGWEPLEPVRKPALSIDIEGILWASAEGAVGLSSIVETIRSTGFGVRLDGSKTDDGWSRVLQLDQLLSGNWEDPLASL